MALLGISCWSLVHNLEMLNWILPFLLFPLLGGVDRWVQIFRVVVMEVAVRCLRPTCLEEAASKGGASSGWQFFQII